jgi:hypothetical protein
MFNLIFTVTIEAGKSLKYQIGVWKQNPLTGDVIRNAIFLLPSSSFYYLYIHNKRPLSKV